METPIKSQSKLAKWAWYAFYILIAAGFVWVIYDAQKPSEMLNSDETTIVCNFGNKQQFTGKTANIHFVSDDFTLSYLPDDKRVALQKLCQITPQEIEGGLNAALDSSDGSPAKLFDVTPKYEKIGGVRKIIRLIEDKVRKIF